MIDKNIENIVISSRVRLARNLDAFPFVNRATELRRRETDAIVRKALNDNNREKTNIIELENALPLTKQLLVEQRLISHQHSESKGPRSVAISNDRLLSIMINEEDHLRMQSIIPGPNLEIPFKRLKELDQELSKKIPFAYDEKLGFLTACPTNIGTGIRCSSMLHLPALRITGEIERVERAARDLDLVIRGPYGEGSQHHGDLYQISNQLTLGCTEENILKKFQNELIPKIISYEWQMREILFNKRKSMVEDRGHRALSVLRSARLLGFDECAKLISRVRLALGLGMLKDAFPPKASILQEIMEKIQTAHLASEMNTNEIKDNELMQKIRAEKTRSLLSISKNDL